ncbi:MAG: DUF362 domain-containing protein [Proteobacteria bacterium]|nr:DUF362 domain-containing protein [Pseudomonadota bacterium]
MHRVLVHDADYSNCRQAVDAAFEMFPVSVAGKKVMIKPNALRASNAQQGIVTHHALVAAVVEKVVSLGAGSIIVGDNPGMMNYGDNEKTFKQTGMMEAAGGYYRNIGTDAVKVDFKPNYLQGRIDSISVSRAILEADVYISLPKFKTHGLSLLSGAIKNNYGIIPGALKARLHAVSGNPETFNRMLVDVYALRVPDLIIVDGVLGMEGNGPASVELREIGKILASDNGVAVDAVIAKMMGVSPEQVPLLVFAREKGLGNYDLKEIQVTGDASGIPGFKLPPMIAMADATPEDRLSFFTSRSSLRPKADEDLCTGCETCVEQCPVSALSMVETLPVVDPEKCIACFCCQEMCPEQAIHLA